MTCNQLLKFIKQKLQENKDDIVNTKGQTLQQIFDELGVNSKLLNLDLLDVQANDCCFRRFDIFNQKYNPMGKPILRELFLKTDNFQQGKYLAELTKQVFQQQEQNNSLFTGFFIEQLEWRISIYGKSMSEWQALSKWIIQNDIQSTSNRWMIQVPRLYKIYKKNPSLGIHSFQDMLNNIFKPIFEATLCPQQHPEIFQFLLTIRGFDTVDDESEYEAYNISGLVLRPDQWDDMDNPPYVYYLYYLYANIQSINIIRKNRGLNTFQFRPHCGESGAVDHLVGAYLLCEGISHGIQLNENSFMCYLYYLQQIGLAVSPLSNNKLFLPYKDNPFPYFFQLGLNVSLSTDDPLIMHMTKEPLIEEYALAAQVWNLNTVDLSEIARNSVLQCGFEKIIKQKWIGKNFDDLSNNFTIRNDKNLSNLPQIRHIFRQLNLKEEFESLDLKY